MLVAKAGGWLDLGYDPFRALAWPPFTLAGALTALSCAWPAVVLALSPQPRSETDLALAVPPVREGVEA
jgi:hypothetical protein